MRFMRSIVLLILDGWGIGEHHQGNPIWQTPTPTFDWIKKNFPSLALQASGINVGLPWGEEGSSEAGHLSLGAGRVLYQHYPRITMAIRDGSFFTNEALRKAFSHAKKNNGRVHLVGLLSSGNVHASFKHLEALLQFAKAEGGSTLLHLFTDGRDSPPKEAKRLIKKLDAKLEEIGAGRIASLSGRFYAMDREEHWERTEKIFRLLAEGGKIKQTAEEIIEEAYGRELTDEFIEPSLIGKPEDMKELLIRKGDAAIFFNFREDSIQQLAQAFTNPDFSAFSRPNLEGIFFVTMTDYGEGLRAEVMFAKEEITQPLGWVLAESGKRQLRLAESEKQPHVTLFFNGLRPDPFPGEYRVIIPSPRTLHFDQVPELSSKELTDRLLQSMEERVYDFILINYANPDLVAHTGNFDAGAKVVELMDRMLNRVAKAALEMHFTLAITSDHGNIESMLNPLTGRPDTQHGSSPVPFHLVDSAFSRARTEKEVETGEKEVRGSLIDVAPTILELMQLPKPETMTGQSLLPYLK